MITDKAYDTLMYALVNAKIYYKITNEEYLIAYKELVYAREYPVITTQTDSDLYQCQPCLSAESQKSV